MVGKPANLIAGMQNLSVWQIYIKAENKHYIVEYANYRKNDDVIIGITKGSKNCKKTNDEEEQDEYI